VEWTDIVKFEKSNNLSVSVFGYEKVSEGEKDNVKEKKWGHVYPLRIASKQCKRVVDLLLDFRRRKAALLCIIKQKVS